MKRLLVIGIAAIVGIASHGVADAQNVTYTDCITPAGHPTIVPRGTRCPSGASSWEGATPARSARAAAAGMSDASLYEAEALDRMMGISPGHGFARQADCGRATDHRGAMQPGILQRRDHRL